MKFFDDLISSLYALAMLGLWAYAIFWVSLFIGIIWVAIHFIVKFW